MFSDCLEEMSPHIFHNDPMRDRVKQKFRDLRRRESGALFVYLGVFVEVMSVPLGFVWQMWGYLANRHLSTLTPRAKDHK